MSFLDGLRKKFAINSELGTVDLVADRFIQLFNQHGIPSSQIPRVFSLITLDDLKSRESLIKKLTPQILDEAANLFGVSAQWLEGVRDDIYEHKSCYKQPKRFFDLLNQLKFDYGDYPIRVLTSAETLNFKSHDFQPILLIVAQKIASLGDDDIFRYYMDTQWDWGHYPCRIQLKAMARVFYKATNMTIPIFKVDLETLQAVAESRIFPTDHFEGSFSTDPSLEDFALWPEESHVAKDKEEMQEVADYIKSHELQGSLIFKNPTANEEQILLDTKKLKPQERARKAANSKNQPGKDLKQRFLEMYADKVRTKSTTASKAASEFYYSIPQAEEKFLFRSEKDYNRLSSQEQEANAKRTLTNAMSLHLKASVKNV